MPHSATSKRANSSFTLSPDHDCSEPLLSPHLRTGYASGYIDIFLCPMLKILRHDAQLHRGAEVCQSPRNAGVRGSDVIRLKASPSPSGGSFSGKFNEWDYNERTVVITHFHDKYETATDGTGILTVAVNSTIIYLNYHYNSSIQC